MPGIWHLEGSHDRRFPRFEAPELPCPTSTFRSVIRQVRPDTLTLTERNFLDAAFAGFLTGTKPPGAVHERLAAASPNTIHEARLPRRYDGDRTLPRGRYATVCSTADGDDGGTLRRELIFYKAAAVAQAHIEIYDPVVIAHREMIDHLGMVGAARERLVLQVIPFAQPSHVTVPLSFAVSLGIETLEVCVDNVLDLRRPAALDWLFRTIPGLHMVFDDAGARQPCFPFRDGLTVLAELLPSLVDQQRGGGNFDKLVGLYLRQIGVSGLVFPAARSDAFTHIVNDELEASSGWSFVDYRDAPPPEIVGFYELRPEWPSTLMVEGGDDHTPRPAAFADEFQIVMTEGFPDADGGFALRGLAQRIEAYHLMDSLEAAVRFRVPDLADEQIDELKAWAVSLGARDCARFSEVVLWSLLGLAQARTDLKAFIREQMGEHPMASLLARCAEPPATSTAAPATIEAFFALISGRSQGHC